VVEAGGEGIGGRVAVEERAEGRADVDSGATVVGRGTTVAPPVVDADPPGLADAAGASVDPTRPSPPVADEQPASASAARATAAGRERSTPHHRTGGSRATVCPAH
jgi:hypothetical protein